MTARPDNNGIGATPNNRDDKRVISMIGNEIDSRALFLLDREIVIAHGDDKYRLRLTSQNKLILTK